MSLSSSISLSHSFIEHLGTVSILLQNLMLEKEQIANLLNIFFFLKIQRYFTLKLKGIIKIPA